MTPGDKKAESATRLIKARQELKEAVKHVEYLKDGAVAERISALIEKVRAGEGDPQEIQTELSALWDELDNAIGDLNDKLATMHLILEDDVPAS